MPNVQCSRGLLAREVFDLLVGEIELVMAELAHWLAPAFRARAGAANGASTTLSSFRLSGVHL
jgi:hypothetical protein